MNILRELRREDTLVVAIASRYDLRRVVHAEEVVRGIEQCIIERATDSDERSVHISSNPDDIFHVEVLHHGQRGHIQHTLLDLLPRCQRSLGIAGPFRC